MSPLESFFKTLKVEEIYRRKYSTMKEAQYFLFDYIERYYSGRYSVISKPSSLQRKPFHNRVHFSGEVR
ncbi:IS3 family transposase [Leptospira borgpetersenii]|nr:IS3 family transposase [Leptospira borgpetersenii]